MVNPTTRDHERVYVVQGTHQEQLDMLRQEGEELFDSGVFVRDGDIFYLRWHRLHEHGFLPSKYVAISPTERSGTIFVADSQVPVEGIVCQITGDEGSVETAIKAFRHIIEYEHGPEVVQALVVKERVEALQSLYKNGFVAVPPEAFERALDETVDALETVGLNPETILDEDKTKMVGWLLKASGGLDSANRLNQVVTEGALGAAYRMALKKLDNVDVITAKYIRMLEAVMSEREFARGRLTEVSQILERGKTYWPQILSRTLEKKDVATITQLIHALQVELARVRVKTYRTTAIEAGRVLQQGLIYLKEGYTTEMPKFLNHAQKILLSDLDCHKEIS